MATRGFILFPTDGAWRIGATHSSEWPRVDELQISTASAPEEVARVIVSALRERGWRAGTPVVLAVPANRCLVASIQTIGLPPRDRKALLYRFEEKLPVAAEEIAADFVHHAD